MLRAMGTVTDSSPKFNISCLAFNGSEKSCKRDMLYFRAATASQIKTKCIYFHSLSTSTQVEHAGCYQKFWYLLDALSYPQMWQVDDVTLERSWDGISHQTPTEPPHNREPSSKNYTKAKWSTSKEDAKQDGKPIFFWNTCKNW